MKRINDVIRWLILPIILLITGCATAPQLGTQGAPSAVPAEGSGRIVFYRPNGLFGYGMRADILLDGQKVARSAPGTKFYVDVPTGMHNVVVPNSLYSGERTLAITVRNRKVTYVRTSLGGSALGGRTNVELIESSQGAAEAEGLELVNL